MAVVRGDRVVDSKKVAQIFAPLLPSPHRVFLVFPGQSHYLLADPGRNLRPVDELSSSPYRGETMFDQLAAFLNAQLGASFR